MPQSKRPKFKVYSYITWWYEEGIDGHLLITRRNWDLFLKAFSRSLIIFSINCSVIELSLIGLDADVLLPVTPRLT